MLIWLICHILITAPTIYPVAILKLFVQFGIKHQISPQNFHSYLGLQYLRFTLIACISNTENSSKEEVDDLPLKILRINSMDFWIGILCTIHKGLNNYQNWRQVRRGYYKTRNNGTWNSDKWRNTDRSEHQGTVEHEKSSETT